MAATKNSKVFISYSHDSEDHMDRVFGLSEKLRDEGVDCLIDQYETSPTGGWPRWTRNQIKEADYVIIVCTKNYGQRYEGTETSGTGVGSKWEGAIITQQLYESEGGPHKFIPVVFSAEETRYIPIELRGATFYILDDKKGYEDLYRHLTSQPRAVKGKLGKLRALSPRARKQDFLGEESPMSPEPRRAERASSATPSASKYSSLVLLMTPDGRTVFIESLRVEAGEMISMSLLPADSREASAIDALSRFIRGEPVGIAFGTKALFANVVSVTHIFEGGREVWKVGLKPEEDNYSSYGALSEMNIGGVSSDKIAEMRARRILLNEKLSGPEWIMANGLTTGLIENAVAVHRGRIQIKESPFPKLYAVAKGDNELFIQTARLYAVLLLFLSGTIRSIHRLELRIQGENELAVQFEGQRPPRYANQEPVTIKVKGTCELIEDA